MTAGHIHEELPALLRGESDRGTVAAAAAHLRACEDCRQELISALVAHAALASAARYAPELLAAPGSYADSSGENDHEPTADDGPSPAPDAVIDSVRPFAGGDGPAPRRRRSVGARWLVAAALAGIGVGIGGVITADRLGTPTGRSVDLAAFDKGTVPARAEILGGQQLRVLAAGLPTPGADRLYEVWLTNDARTQMYAVGSLPAGRSGSFTVAPALLHRYTAIEISVQPLNNSGYSGTSVLRGRYG